MESSEVDLSDFQDADDGTNVPADNDAGQPTEMDAAPQQDGPGRFPLIIKMAFLCVLAIILIIPVPCF